MAFLSTLRIPASPLKPGEGFCTGGEVNVPVTLDMKKVHSLLLAFVGLCC